jgi:O-antigen ligase
MTHPGLRPGWSLLGFLLAGALAAVALVVERRTGAPSGPVIALVTASAGVVTVAVLVGALHRAVIPLWLALVISSVSYDWAGDLDGGPLSGPFGYRNAFGALLLLGALAWVMGGVALRRPALALLSFVPAVVLGALAIRSSSATAAGAALVAVAALACFGTKGARTAVMACGAATAIVLAATIWMGATYQPGRPPTGVAARIADAGITERRLALWHDALEIIGAHPTGIGHGRFVETSTTALGDRDAAHAHQEFLEQGAELGWVGLALTIALLAWTFARLAITRRADAVTALSAVALAGASIHASVDYVWHFPPIPLATAALVATGFIGEDPAEGEA